MLSQNYRSGTKVGKALTSMLELQDSKSKSHSYSHHKVKNKIMEPLSSRVEMDLIDYVHC